MAHFVAITEGTLAEGLVRLFRNNVWKLHGLLESIILDREPQFVVELTKKLNRMLRIKMKLSISFYPQTDEQTEWMNQKLEQYLQFSIDHRQKCQPEWLVTAKFVVNNKVHSATKVLLFIANYSRELRIETDIRRKSKKSNKVCRKNEKGIDRG